MWLSSLHADDHGCVVSRMAVVQFSKLGGREGSGLLFHRLYI